MKTESARAILKALTDADVRFLLVGGLAVNVYGLLRLTLDIDVVIQLSPDNIGRAFQALAPLGYRPMVPVTADQFADPFMRATWIHEKGMRVLRFHSDGHWQTPVDFFVTEPFPFDEEYAKATIREISGIGGVRVVSLETLRQMKQEAGRPQDVADLDNLRLQE